MNTRQQDIIRLLESNGEMTIKALSETLNVTAMTIHRDLDYLEQQHYLYKKRGAAVFVNAPDRHSSSYYVEEKRKIGRRAAKFIRPGQSILFDNSTTAIEAARALSGIPRLTFYTTNLEAAAILAGYPDTVLYCSGGYYFPDSRGFVGKQAEEFVTGIHADVCLIGASGIAIDTGVTNPYPMHSSLQRKIIEASDCRILLADHSKFGKRAMEKAADLCEISRIITDPGLPDEVFDEYSGYVKIDIAQ